MASDLTGPIRTLFSDGTSTGLSDAQLLERFASGSNAAAAQTAFATLVARHGPMVLRVCRAALADPNDADDAFQATFLVLVRRAREVRQRESLASWLHGVALRVASCARRSAARRRVHERKGAEMVRGPEAGAGEPDLGRVVHEEVGRLPESYRAPIVLCYLEGLTHDAAAARLGWPVGTVRSRLTRGRERLRGRLVRRGLAPAAIALETLFAGDTASAAVPKALAETTVGAAVRLAAGESAATAVVLTLTEEALKAMNMARLRIIGMSVLAGAVAASGAAVIAVGAVHRTAEAPRAVAQERADRPSDPPEDPVGRALRAATPDVEALGDADAKARAMLDLGNGLIRVGDRGSARLTLRRAAHAAEAMPMNEWRLLQESKIAEALARAGDPETARALFDRVNAATAEIKGVQWQASRWGATAEAQAASGGRAGAHATIRRAHAAIAELKDDNERFSALRRLLPSQAKLGDYDGAFAAIVGIPDEQSHQRDPLLRAVVKTLESKDQATALKVLRRATEIAAGISADLPRGLSQMTIAPELARAGDIDWALRLAHAIGKGNLQFADRDAIPLALAAIAPYQARSGDREGAHATLAEALEVAKSLPQDGAIKGERLRRVAEEQAGLGDANGALHTAELILNNEYEKAHALRAVAEALAKAGRREDARDAFRRAVASGENLRPRKNLLGDRPDLNQANVLREIAEAQARSGDIAGALETARTHGDASWQAGVRTEIAGIQARSGDIAGALETAQLIRDAFYRPIVMAQIAEAQARSGDVAGALAWATRLDSPQAKASALASLAAAARRAGDDNKKAAPR